jgi:hypothetical protein
VSGPTLLSTGATVEAATVGDEGCSAPAFFGENLPAAGERSSGAGHQRREDQRRTLP